MSGSASTRPGIPSACTWDREARRHSGALRRCAVTWAVRILTLSASDVSVGRQRDSPERGSYMSKHGSAATARAGTALAATALAGAVLAGFGLVGFGLAGCSGSVPKGTTPQVTANTA